MRTTVLTILVALVCFIFGRYTKEPYAYSTNKKNRPLSDTAQPLERVDASLSIDMMYLINSERSRNNLKNMDTDNRLLCAAQIYAKEIYQKDSCVNNTNEYFLARTRKCGMPNITGAQTIACKDYKIQNVLRTWLSTDNKKILLNPDYTKFGCEVERGYWVCVFSL